VVFIFFGNVFGRPATDVFFDDEKTKKSGCANNLKMTKEKIKIK